MKKKVSAIILLLISLLVLTACHKHEVSEWNTIDELTCTNRGYKEGFCKCGEKLFVEVQPSGHQYVNKVCCVCGAQEGSVGLQIVAEGDSYASVVGIGTCTDIDIVIPSIYQTEDYRFLEVTNISSRAFENCTNIKSITIPNGVTTISSDAFEGCYIERATIPANACAAIKNNNLKEIVITGNPWFSSNILSSAFSGCINLEKVTIGEGVRSIGTDAFSGCINLEKVTIGEGVRSIGSGAFANCSRLNNIAIPSGVTYINGYTFSGCTSLSDVIIPESVTGIGAAAFRGCASLSSVTIPKGVTSIESWTFSGCASLSSITIPEGVTDIGYYAFSGCTSIIDITIPSSVISIKMLAFADCTGLTSVIIGERVTSIDSSVFKGCVSLERVIIPSSVTSIGGNAFWDSTNLTIYCEAKSKPEGWDSAWNRYNDDKIYWAYLEVVWGYEGE